MLVKEKKNPRPSQAEDLENQSFLNLIYVQEKVIN
jgi:hypothetical protein